MSETRPVTMRAATEHVVAAPGIATAFTVAVARPLVPVAEGTKLPAIYVIDADMFFGLAVDTVRGAQDLPPALVVGIGYDALTSVLDFTRKRTRDLTPTVDPAAAQRMAERMPGLGTPETGGAAAFLDFLVAAVKPLVEGEYGADPGDATLVGDSLGGLFALHTLFTRPGTFQRYVAGSPSLWWDSGAVLADEERYAATHTDLGVRLFLSVGALEQETEEELPFRMVSNYRELERRLRGRAYPSLRLTTHVFEAETHGSVIPATFSRGLRAVFAP